MALKIIGRRENKTGGNTHYKLSDGRVVTRTEGVAIHKQGKLPSYNIVKVKGKKYLRDNPDGKKRDNIDSQKLI